MPNGMGMGGADGASISEEQYLRVWEQYSRMTGMPFECPDRAGLVPAAPRSAGPLRWRLHGWQSRATRGSRAGTLMQ